MRFMATYLSCGGIAHPFAAHFAIPKETTSSTLTGISLFALGILASLLLKKPTRPPVITAEPITRRAPPIGTLNADNLASGQARYISGKSPHTTSESNDSSSSRTSLIEGELADPLELPISESGDNTDASSSSNNSITSQRFEEPDEILNSLPFSPSGVSLTEEGMLGPIELSEHQTLRESLDKEYPDGNYAIL